nr:MAG TPA: hypothetical protein [Microviridae sp.]
MITLQKIDVSAYSAEAQLGDYSFSSLLLV